MTEQPRCSRCGMLVRYVHGREMAALFDVPHTCLPMDTPDRMREMTKEERAEINELHKRGVKATHPRPHGRDRGDDHRDRAGCERPQSHGLRRRVERHALSLVREAVQDSERLREQLRLATIAEALAEAEANDLRQRVEVP